jgi:hypothetical protein
METDKTMTIKYKLGFTIDSEVMFMLLSKFLPIQDLSVEEVVVPVPAPSIRFDKRFDLPKRTKARAIKGQSNLTQGVNAIIMGVLSDRQEHSYLELRQAVGKTNYSPNGLGARMARLVTLGYVNRLGDGKYRATTKAIPSAQENAT